MHVFKNSPLLNVHFISDEDIRNRTSFASKIGATTDAARPIPLGEAVTRMAEV